MRHRRYSLPSTSALIAFEAVARRQGFARAAEELNTSQPAISRHIRNLEIRLGAPLFERLGTRIRLTRAGETFYATVVQALDDLQSSVDTASSRRGEVTLACSHAVSQLLLMPHYNHLRRALGADVDLRFLTAEYDLTQAAIDTGADIVFEYARVAPARPHVVVVEERMKPVGAPQVVDRAVAALRDGTPPPGLLDLRRAAHGWMGWHDWKRAHPAFAHWPVTDSHDNYVYLLDSAAQGAGLALGWQGFVTAHLARGELVEMPVDWYAENSRIFARLTRSGLRNPAAAACLAALEDLAEPV